jgi:hypothetical protein
MTEPGFIALTVSRVISFGARAPGTRTVELRRYPAQGFGVAIQHHDVGTHPGRDQCRITAGNTAAQNHDIGRRNPRHPAKQHAAPAVYFFQAQRADLRRHPAGHFRHGREQRQRALRSGDRFIGDRGNAGVQ